MVLRKTVSREQLLSNSRAWRTTSRRTTSHQRLARTAQTNLESLLLERLLLHLWSSHVHIAERVLYPDCADKRVVLRVIDTLRPIGFDLPSTNQSQGEYTRSRTKHACRVYTCRFHGCMFAQTTRYNPPQPNTIHMRCSHHTHWVNASVLRGEKIDKNAIVDGTEEIGRCGWRER